MELEFSRQQHEFAAMVKRFLQDACEPDVIRASWDTDWQGLEVLWQPLAEMGVIGATVPEAYGGLALEAIDLTLIIEQLGAACFPGPLIETTMVAAPLLVAYGTESQKERWLPRIADGTAKVSLLPSGTPFAAHLTQVDAVIADLEGELHIVPSDACLVRPVPSSDPARRLGELQFEPSTSTRMIASPSQSADLLNRAASATASFLNGISTRLLDLTVSYVGVRRQFGRSIGTFQAVQHKLAEVHVAADTARGAGWYSAAALTELPNESGIAASIAKAYASDAARKANYECLQCHGAIGFTWEHDLHIWLKRGRALEAAYGSAQFHRSRVARYLLDTTA